MYDLLKHAHSGLRWLVLIFLVVAVVNAIMKRGKSSEYTKGDKMPVLLALIFTHIQLLIGFWLYFISQKFSFANGMGALMKNAVERFYGVEHVSMMIIAVILITIGYSKAKRVDEAAKKHNTVMIFYGIGLILILASIPWPFRTALGAGWF